LVQNFKGFEKKIESKKQKLNEPGEKVMDISFDLDSAMEVETESSETRIGTQTEEFDYLFRTAVAKRPPFDETYFADENDKASPALHPKQ